MRKHSALLVAAILLVSSGIASAQSQTPMTKDRAPATSGQSAPQSDPARGTGVTGAPSSTNPQAGGGGAGYQTPREVPEAGGAPNKLLLLTYLRLPLFGLPLCGRAAG